jgi:heme exporter protein C
MQVARGTAGASQAPSASGAARRPGKALSVWERVVVGLGVATAVGMLASIWAVFAYAPTDALQGNVQRIFYFHVPMAWDAYLAFFVVFVASIAYLWRRDERWDSLARAAAEIGTVFTTLVLITGSLWGKPIWGTWWTWDARLTTTLILWFIYVGYLMLRSYTGRTASGARAAAVLGIVGFVDVPIDYLSVTWWRTIHPAATYVVDNGQSALPPAALQTFMLALLTFTLLFALLMVLVYRLERIQAGVEKLRGRIED